MLQKGIWETILVRISKIPDTVKSMRYTFRGCNKLDEMPELPDSVENLMCTFFGTSIRIAKKVPNNVKKCMVHL